VRGRAGIAHLDEIRGQVVITTSARTDVIRRMIDDARLSIVKQPSWDLDAQSGLGLEAFGWYPELVGARATDAVRLVPLQDGGVDLEAKVVPDMPGRGLLGVQSRAVFVA
jgi:hypothetical protein